MNKNDYKRAFGQMEPDPHFGQRLARKLAEQGQTKTFGLNRRVILSAAACLVVIACAGIFTFTNLGGESTPIASVPPVQTDADGSVFIPKIELPKNKTSEKMDMIGLIVYQGRIYTQTSARIPPEAAKAVLGEKIGRTKGNINEWSNQKEYAKELASSIGEQDVYSVKGYHTDFRIMTYQVADGQIWTEFYECLNGIKISSGGDVLQKLKIMGNVQTASWEDFESWNGGKKQVQKLPLGATLDDFLQALYAAKPIPFEKLYSQGIYDQRGQSNKFVYLKLKDQSEVRLDLHQGGYVRYVPANVFFKLDDVAFAAMWGILK